MAFSLSLCLMVPRVCRIERGRLGRANSVYCSPDSGSIGALMARIFSMSRFMSYGELLARTNIHELQNRISLRPGF
jgi:hypothetical protein